MKTAAVTGAALLSLTFLACVAAREDDAPAETATARASGTDEAAIRTDRTRYPLQHGPWGPETAITATFRAPEERAVYLVNCNGAIAGGLQRLAGDAWVHAWGAAIDACLSPPIVVAPGARHTDRLILRPGAGAVIDPSDARERLEPGTYRVVWHGVLTSFDPDARPFGAELPLEQRVSSPFAIEPAPPRPAAIASLAPPDGARVSPDTPLSVTFDFGRAGFRLAPGSLRLHVDGTEVSEQMTRAATEDVPPSQTEIAFRPASGWSPGHHAAYVTFADFAGNPSSYSWTFTVQE